MRNLIIISIFLLLVLVVTPKHVFAERLSHDLPYIEVADFFYAPWFNDTGLFGAFGGYFGGDSSNQLLDWSIGNTIPHSDSMTDDIVFSTCIGHFMNPADWFERMRITKEGNIVINGVAVINSSGQWVGDPIGLAVVGITSTKRVAAGSIWLHEFTPVNAEPSPSNAVALTVPFTSSFVEGSALSMPTLPSFVTRILSNQLAGFKIFPTLVENTISSVMVVL